MIETKTIWWGRIDDKPLISDRCLTGNGPEQQFVSTYLVIFQDAMSLPDEAIVRAWLSNNCSGHFYSHVRDDLGPSGEMFFEYEDDALLFFLAFK